MNNSPTFDGPCLFRSHMMSSPFRELVNILLMLFVHIGRGDRYVSEEKRGPNDEPPTPHPTSVSAESTLSPLPSHRFLDASRRYPAREVVDFWEGPIPAGPGSIEEDTEASATEELADWGWEAGEGDEARIIRRAAGRLATKLNGPSTDPPSNDYDPSPACFFVGIGDSS
jgi:hypothetical protein